MIFLKDAAVLKYFKFVYMCCEPVCIYVCHVCAGTTEEVRVCQIPCVAVTCCGKPPGMGAGSSVRGDTVLITESHFPNPSSN